MPKRVVEIHQEDTFEDPEQAREYARMAARSSNRRFDGFIKVFDALNIKGKCLEIGAGSGILAAMLAERNKDIKITATDPSETMLQIAHETISEKNLKNRIRLIKGDGEDEKFLSDLETFDAIYSTFSLHHWDDPEKVLKNLYAKLNPGGYLIIYDLKRVWWLYCIPKKSGFFQSIRAAYTPREIGLMLAGVGIVEYDLVTVPPFFLFTLTIKKPAAT